MPEFGVLTNRKRSVIALVHSIFFLALAIWSTLQAPVSAGLYAALNSATHDGMPSAIAMSVIYLIVSWILFWLLGISRCAIERAYFVFCASSASFGLLRAIAGSTGLQSAQYIRVMMLAAAVVTGMFIVRMYDSARVMIADAEGAD